MNTALLFVAVLQLGVTSPRDATPQPAGCTVCHGTEGKQFVEGVHTRAGIGCVDCHGGNASALEKQAAHGPDLRVPKDARSALKSCADCHSDVERMRLYGLRTDQLSLYWTSGHGHALTERGVETVATCVSCHGSHGILPPSDPRSRVHPRRQPDTCGACHANSDRMREAGASTSVVADYSRSVHGRALLVEAHPAAPSCTDCHGSHGAAPPRIREVEQVCGHCHSVVQAFYERSPHFRDSSAAIVQCASCHENHEITPPSRELFLGADEHHCGSCHTEENDPALKVAQVLYDDLGALEESIDDAQDSLSAAAESGLFLDEEEGYLNDARALLVRARALTHSLDPNELDGVLNRGRAMVSETLERLAIKKRKLRDRKIFTGVFFFLSAAFAVLLMLYAVEYRGRPPRGWWNHNHRGA